MQSSNRFIARVATPAACLGLLGACASSEVRGAGAPVFPDLPTATFAGGTYPNVDNLPAIAPGMTQDQLYDLIGPPPSPEGRAAGRRLGQVAGRTARLRWSHDHN